MTTLSALPYPINPLIAQRYPSPQSKGTAPDAGLGSHSLQMKTNNASPSLPSPERSWGKLGWAGLLFSLGLATHHLPAKAVSQTGKRFLISPDWKSWARVGLGIATVSQLNQGLQWKPPAWLAGLEAAAVITPMALRFNKASVLTFGLVAPLVAGMVQVNQWAQKLFIPDLKTYCHLPETLSRLGLSLSVGGLGILASLALHRQVRQLPLEKLPLKSFPGLRQKVEILQKNLTEILGAGATVQQCARGCSPSIICLSEIGEMIGGMWQGHQQR